MGLVSHDVAGKIKWGHTFRYRRGLSIVPQDFWWLTSIVAWLGNGGLKTKMQTQGMMHHTMVYLNHPYPMLHWL